jgi:beta-glucanase (GH16 family)
LLHARRRHQRHYFIDKSCAGIEKPQTLVTGVAFFCATTDGKYTIPSYGYFEVRAKMPAGESVWPAFWLLDHTEELMGDCDQPYRPEIDVYQYYPQRIGGDSSQYDASILELGNDVQCRNKTIFQAADYLWPPCI